VSGVLLDRRELLGLAGAGTTAAALTVLAPTASAAGKPAPASTRTVYRRRAVGRTTCNACKAANANRFYRTMAAAARDKTHRGCNCAVISHSVQVNKWNEYFKRGNKQTDLWDVRWGKKAPLTTSKR